MFSLAFLIITVRLVEITMPNKNELSSISSNDSNIAKRVKRTDIIDGLALYVTSLPTVNLYANPK